MADSQLINVMTMPRAHSILEAVHETACDLYRLGFINETKMYEFEIKCIDREVPVADRRPT